MKKFEYREEVKNINDIGEVQYLNEKGNDGWEFIRETYDKNWPNYRTYLFKREIIENVQLKSRSL